MDYNIIAAGFIMGCAAIGAGLGIALIGAKYLEGISRQPELTNFLRTQFFIILALVDAVPMIALGISLYLIFA